MTKASASAAWRSRRVILQSMLAQYTRFSNSQALLPPSTRCCPLAHRHRHMHPEQARGCYKKVLQQEHDESVSQPRDILQFLLRE